MDKLYIPGDLVSVYVGIKKYIVEVIGTENENEVLSYQIKFPNGEIQYADKDNIAPIWKGIHTEEEIINLIKNDSFLSKQFNLK